MHIITTHQLVSSDWPKSVRLRILLKVKPDLQIIQWSSPQIIMSNNSFFLMILVILMTCAPNLIRGQTSGGGESRVKVSVFYETLCPDSIAFIRYQLYPTFQNVSDIMDVELVPYGKASYTQLPNGTVTFRCQHGPRECRGNMIQACAIKIMAGNMSQIVPFIKCMESQRHPDTSGAKCARQLDIEYSQIQSCSNGPLGQEYLMQMGIRTEGLHPQLHFVPWININDQHTQKNQDDSLDNLLKVVCTSYTGNDRPSSCSPFESHSLQGHTPAPTIPSWHLLIISCIKHPFCLWWISESSFDELQSESNHERIRCQSFPSNVSYSWDVILLMIPFKSMFQSVVMDYQFSSCHVRMVYGSIDYYRKKEWW